MMNTLDALKVLAQHRKNEVVIAAMTSNQAWQMISSHELDLPLSGCMGKASSLGLGLALARPDIQVWVVDGDGSLLNNLGTLVTIGNLGPPNLVHFVLHNGVYQVSGGQPLPGEGKFTFCDLARAAGYASTHVVDALEDLETRLPAMLSAPRPALVCLDVKPSKERISSSMASTAKALPRVKAILERSVS
ncbi:MAG: thiamine pyrophosphate-binding protein [Chloroflexi bacterium]|nr:thiamine pyrophosphate-binding protein [Chloroflexota bacterium]